MIHETIWLHHPTELCCANFSSGLIQRRQNRVIDASFNRIREKDKLKVSVKHNRKKLSFSIFPRSPRSLHRLVPTACIIKASDGKDPHHLTKLSSYLAAQIVAAVPQPIKEFPYAKAKSVLEERFLLFVEKSLITLFVLVSVHDTLSAVYLSMELLVPLGLFIGVLLSSFLYEVCQELFEGNAKLFGIGLLFVALKLIYYWFEMPGEMLLPHIGNGGLMQVLWLGKQRRAGIIRSE